MRFIPFALAALVGLALLVPAMAEDDATAVAEKPKALDFGETIDEISGPTADGGTAKLSELMIDKAKAEAAVLDVAKAYAKGKPVTLATKVAALEGVLVEGELDEDLVREMVAKAGQRFGLTVNDDRLDRVQTLADVASWIQGSKDSPILVVVWSPRCPMCKGIYDERLSDVLAETGVRCLVIAGSYPDKAEHVTSYLEENGYAWKVILDPEQKIVDRLGAKKTPHLFLFDKDLKLHYRGGVDDDPRGEKSDDEREDWLMDAVEAIVEGRDVEVTDTMPPG